MRQNCFSVSLRADARIETKTIRRKLIVIVFSCCLGRVGRAVSLPSLNSNSFIICWISVGIVKEGI